MIAYLYSDVSQRHMAIGYCCIIQISRWAGPFTATYTGDLTDAGGVASAEIEALAIAIENCPRENVECVSAFTDLDFLPGLMTNQQKSSYEKTLAKAIRRLRLAAVQFPRVEYRNVPRLHPMYLECHKESRKQAIEAAKKRGTLGQVPIGMTPSREEFFGGYNRPKDERDGISIVSTAATDEIPALPHKQNGFGTNLGQRLTEAGVVVEALPAGENDA